MIKEEWKQIDGFEYYYISNLGRVKSTRRWSGTQFYEREKIISLHKHKTKGYIYVSISRDGKNYNLRVHKLVATAFISNPNCYKQINHIDGNKSNNKVENLEWCDCSYNIKDMYKRQGKYKNDNIIIEKYKDLKSCNKVAKLFNTTGENIRQVLIRNNIERK